MYPYSNLATQVLGYCTIDNTGQAGVESYYNKYLKGVNGKSLTQTNAQGKEIDNTLDYYIPSIPGFNLNLSVDVQMQKAASQRRPMSSMQHTPQDNFDFSEEKGTKYKKVISHIHLLTTYI